MPEIVYNVLIVDDEALGLQSFLEPRCESLNLRFRNETDPTNAIKRFKFESIDFVLLDIYFEGGPHGIDVLKEIQRMFPPFPVALITSFQREKGEEILQSLNKAKIEKMPKFFFRAEVLENPSILINYIRQTVASCADYFDQEHMKTADEFSESYDEEEWGNSATKAFAIWENELVSKLVDDMGRRLQDGFGREPIAVLDVGCGTGRFEFLLAEKDMPLRMTAVDFSAGMLRLLDQRIKTAEASPEDPAKVFFGQLKPEGFRIRKTRTASIRLERGIAEDLGFRDEEFDVVLMGFGLPSYTRYDNSLKEARRVLKNGGYALFTVYNEESIFRSALSSVPPDQRPFAAQFEEDQDRLWVGGRRSITAKRFKMKHFRQLLEDKSFQILRCASYPTLQAAFPRNMLDRLGEKLGDLSLWDKYYSEALKDKGYYLSFIAQKV